MKTGDRDQLLNQVLGGDDLEPFRQASLETGLASLRHRRRRRRVAQVWVVACSVFFVGLAVFRQYLPNRAAGNMTRLPHSSAVSISDNSPGPKIITDEELFALFPGRAMALVGKPGHQQLVFLDQGGSSRQPLLR